MLQLKLGKKPARPDAVKFKLSKYLNLSALPSPPKSFGHELGIIEWGMLGNDEAGDCVPAGGGHETILWNKEAGKDVVFDTKATISDYTAMTGYDPNNKQNPNPTDQGTDMAEAASYRRKTGLIDANGNRHKVAAYLSITPGDLHEHLIAAYLFSAVGIGIQFPGSAMDQFNNNQPWKVVKGSQIEGGHYIPLVAHRKSYLEIITWGKIQPMTVSFFEKYNDESLVYLSEEMLVNQKSAEGFDYQTLINDLAQLH